VDALNEFIEAAKTKLPKERNKLLVIADGLEKIQYISQSDRRSNHDDIFITKAPQLKSLACHVIYTVPVSLALSTRASDLMDIYGCSPDVLPMVGVRSKQGVEQLNGMAKMREMLASRINQISEAQKLKLEGEVFADGETLDLLCRMSGGHVRNLVLLMQSAIDYQDQLPLTRNSVELALRKMRRTYRESVNATANEWELLAQVSLNKIAPNDDQFRSLLFRRCILQYLDETGKTWHDVHPLLENTEEFQAALLGVTT
jgi:Phosphotyrosine interaction domain (PTB/PID)